MLFCIIYNELEPLKIHLKLYGPSCRYSFDIYDLIQDIDLKFILINF